MSVISDYLIVDTLAILVTAIVILIAFIKWQLNYWQRLGVPTLDKSRNPFDVLLKKRSFAEATKNTYDQFKAKGVEYGGVYQGANPLFIVISPEMIKTIVQKDFQYFASHGMYFNDKIEPLSGHLFNLDGQRWRNMRIKLTPTFTSGKMKMMFQTIVDCAKGFEELLSDSAKNKIPIEMKDTLARFTTDIIGSCAFGIECNSLKNPDAEFRKYGRKVFEGTNWNRIKGLMRAFLPPRLLHLLKVRIGDREVEDFFMAAVENAVNYREINQIYRKDFLHLLIQLKNLGKVSDDGKLLLSENDGKGDDSITMNELAAQAFVFFLAGFETSSTLMTFALYEIARNPDIQEKMRNEIHEILTKHNNQLTYDAVMEMKYLEKVTEETLRRYPPVSGLPRQCTRDYQIPGTSITIKEGTRVSVPVYGVHMDPEYYPNPEIFDPERFTEENKAKRPPCTWIPFGEGPRICIGLRFGLMQAKVGLITLLNHFKISLNEKTKTPMTFDRNTFIISIDGGLWLDFEAI